MMSDTTVEQKTSVQLDSCFGQIEWSAHRSCRKSGSKMTVLMVSRMPHLYHSYCNSDSQGACHFPTQVCTNHSSLQSSPALPSQTRLTLIHSQTRPVLFQSLFTLVCAVGGAQLISKDEHTSGSRTSVCFCLSASLACANWTHIRRRQGGWQSEKSFGSKQRATVSPDRLHPDLACSANVIGTAFCVPAFLWKKTFLHGVFTLPLRCRSCAGFLNRGPCFPLGATSRGLYCVALPWYCKTLLMSRGPQVLTVFGRGSQTMKGWEPLI